MREGGGRGREGRGGEGMSSRVFQFDDGSGVTMADQGVLRSRLCCHVNER